MSGEGVLRTLPPEALKRKCPEKVSSGHFLRTLPPVSRVAISGAGFCLLLGFPKFSSRLQDAKKKVVDLMENIEPNSRGIPFRVGARCRYGTNVSRASAHMFRHCLRKHGVAVGLECSHSSRTNTQCFSEDGRTALVLAERLWSIA